MAQDWGHVHVFLLIAFIFCLQLTLSTSFQENRRFLFVTECSDDSDCHCQHPGSIPHCEHTLLGSYCHCKEAANKCPDGQHWHCHLLGCHCGPTRVNGGWSDWNSTACSASCGEGSVKQQRFCNNPAPVHGGEDCKGESSRTATCNHGPCPTTTQVAVIKCLADVNCTNFHCPGHQHPFCEPNINWSSCQCTECTTDNHCSCPLGTLPHCRDETFERKCECVQVHVSETQKACSSDSECSTYNCTEHHPKSFCHRQQFLVFDLSSCDCRECSDDSHCQCQQPDSIPHCEHTVFGSYCHCKDAANASSLGHLTSTHTTHPPSPKTTVKTTLQTTTSSSASIENVSMGHVTSTHTSHLQSSKTTTKTTLPTATPSTASTQTMQGSTEHQTSAAPISPVVSSNVQQESTTKPTSMVSTDVPTDLTTEASQTVQPTETTDLRNSTIEMTTPTTIKPHGKRKCHICGDSANSISCDTRDIYLGNLQECGPGLDFCMTDLIHNDQPYPSFYKRCVSEDECRNKWLHQTSDLEYCTNYGNVLVEGQYSCHFCCTSDGCNSGQIPDKSTFYTKA